MRDLPVRKLPGVGKVNEHILAGLNIYYCKDLVERATEVYATFTEWAYEFLLKSALGISRVMHEVDDKGVVGQRSSVTTAPSLDQFWNTLIVCRQLVCLSAGNMFFVRREQCRRLPAVFPITASSFEAVLRQF